MNILYLHTDVSIGMKGYFRFICRNKFNGKITQDTGWFPNTILDAGRNIMATRDDWMTWCQVGTDGNFPVLLGDRQAETSLGGWHAGTDAIVAGSILNGQAGTAPYFGWKRKTWRFPAGTVAANLSEAAVGWGETGSTIISRAPILDPVLETPTTVTPLVDEILDVMYELRYYPPLVDVTSPQVVLNGVTYNTISRASSVTAAPWSDGIGSKIGVASLDKWNAYDGDLGTIVTSPSGNSAGAGLSNLSNSSYSNNSYEIAVNINVLSSAWNLAAGIRSVQVHTSAGTYQTQFNAVGTDARIPKTTSFVMNMTWKLNWAEKV